MKVELRNFEFYPRLSEETNAFNADLWIDGKKVGTAENDGKGGMNRLYFQDRKAEEAFNAFCQSQPDEQTEYGPLPVNADYYISRLVDQKIQQDQIREWNRASVVFRLPYDKQGTYHTIPHKGARQIVVNAIKARYPEAEIVEA